MHTIPTTVSIWFITAALAVHTGSAGAAEAAASCTPPAAPGDIPVVPTGDDASTADGPSRPAWEDRLRAKLRANRVPLAIQERPLAEVAAHLRTLGRMNLVIDPQVWAAVGRQPITLQQPGATWEAALAQIALQTRTRHVLVDDAVYLIRRAEDDGGRFERMERELARTFALREPGPAVRRMLARLDQVVTLHLEECPLDEALDLAERGLGIDLVVKPEVAALSREVSLHVEEMRGRHALNHLMRVAGLRHAFEHERLVISVMAEPPLVAERLAQPGSDLPQVTLRAEETESGDLIGFLERIAEVPLRIDPRLAGQRLSAEFERAPLMDVLLAIAGMTGGTIVPLPEDPRGFLITPNAADESEPIAPSAAQ